jgi:hypothetical protein
MTFSILKYPGVLISLSKPQGSQPLSQHWPTSKLEVVLQRQTHQKGAADIRLYLFLPDFEVFQKIWFVKCR